MKTAERTHKFGSKHECWDKVPNCACTISAREGRHENTFNYLERETTPGKALHPSQLMERWHTLFTGLWETSRPIERSETTEMFLSSQSIAKPQNQSKLMYSMEAAPSCSTDTSTARPGGLYKENKGNKHWWECGISLWRLSRCSELASI